tara:strand:- start:78 stop:2057 length:1980 start_codon:yes stop_codon:yes gene_type:complete
MAIIYSYPNKATLVDADEVLIIDSESINPAKQTKHTSLSSLLTYIDNNLDYDLQQVLTSGATAYAPLIPGWNGQLRLGYNDGLGSNIDKVIINTSSASSYVLTLIGSVTQTGDYELKLNSSDFVLDGGALTAKSGNNTNIRSASGYDVAVSPNGDFFVTTDADIRHESRDFIGVYNRTLDLRATTGASLSAITGAANIDGNTINISASTIAELKAGTNTLVVTDGSVNSTVNIGGTISNNRADGVFIQTENFLQARTNSGQGKFYIIGGALPGTDSDFINSVHPHTFMDEIRLGGEPAEFNETAGTKTAPGLKGSAGTAGEVLTTGGAGSPATWTRGVDTISWPTNAAIVGDASNTGTSTAGKLEVDVANDTVKIGETAATTDILITSTKFRAEVVNNTAAGFNNFVIGSSALSQAFANGGGGINNTALGVAAMSGNAGSGNMEAAYNVAVGQNTLASGTGLTNTVLFNTAVGYRAMAGTGAGPTTYNTAIGANSLENINAAPAETFGDLNTAVGSSSLFNLTNGEENVAVGSSAGTGLTSGKYNTFVGTNANSTSAAMQLATSIGYNADVTADGGTALGANSVVTGIGGVALGARAIAAANRLNIKVDNVAGPNPQGGLPTFADRAAALAGGLTPGDVYCAAPGGPDNPGSSFLLAII